MSTIEIAGSATAFADAVPTVGDALGAIERHPVTDRESWLRLRKLDVTASDAAAICQVEDAYRSAREVWLEKKGVISGQTESPLMLRGRLLEPSIWATVQHHNPAWEIRAAKVYLRSPLLRLGATPDALAVDPTRDGLVLIQGKVVSRPAFESLWLGGHDNPAPPLPYQIQVLVERMLVAAAFPGTPIHAMIAACVVGDRIWDYYPIPIQRHAEAERRILHDVAKFWRDFDAGIMPPLDPAKDGDLVKKLYPQDNGSTIDLSGDNSVTGDWDERKRLTEEIKVREARKDALTTAIKDKIGDHAYALIGDGRKLSCKTVEIKEHLRVASVRRDLREIKMR